MKRVDFEIDTCWAFAWGVRPGNPKAFICVSTLASTRSEAWNDLLEAWFNYNSTTKRYYRGGPHDGVTRDAAIKFLKRRGGMVIKVKVVPVE